MKPAPDMLLAGIQQLSTQPADALYIGDMVVDIETARAAQVCVWAVATGSDDRDKLAAARPDRLLEDMAEANQLLRSTL